jgi:hypothetical protein
LGAPAVRALEVIEPVKLGDNVSPRDPINVAEFNSRYAALVVR